jgi:hypothetical protein
VEVVTHEKQNSYQGMTTMDMGGGEANGGPEIRELGYITERDIYAGFKRRIAVNFEWFHYLFL